MTPWVLDDLGVGCSPMGTCLRQNGIFLAAVSLCLCLLVPQAFAEEWREELEGMDLASLLQLEVSSASGLDESLIDAPAATIVITSEQIRQRGYSTLGEVLGDLPGFDVSSGGSRDYTFQRGYRTPTTSRTLFMIDGRPDMNLWNQQAVLNRQFALSAFERIEVLYGPTSVIYGPNAFLGIVNLITKQAKPEEKGVHDVSVLAEAGSWDSRAGELSAHGNAGGLRYSVAARVARSDEADLEGRWGFLDNSMYSDPDTWGPLLDVRSNGRNLGSYHTPTDDRSFMGDFSFKGFTLGWIYWEDEVGYGGLYAADRGQSNASWMNDSGQVYLEHEAMIKERFGIKTLGLYRRSRTWGNWAEAEPDWNPGMEQYSYISFTNWNSTSDAFLFKQDYDYRWTDAFRLAGGIRYLREDLTKLYDVPGYWAGSYSSTVPESDPGPHGLGAAIGHSLDPTYNQVAKPKDVVPDENRTVFTDVGGYAQLIWDQYPWRVSGGLRVDHHSVYGTSTNPRVSLIYKFFESKGAVKLVYGEAFQEPAASALFGGWSGRLANPDLEPEEARNIELIFMYQQPLWVHDISLFYAHYDNVIKEELENAGEREVYGAEYRGRFEFENFIPRAPEITGNLYYTYTHSESAIHYDHALDEWVDGATELGDIAPHKVNLAINLPFTPRWNFNLRANWRSDTTLYTRNALRDDGVEIPSHTVVDATLGYRRAPIDIRFKVRNLFDEDYFGPGIGAADAGNDFSQRSLGYWNSLIPQPGRSIWLTLRFDFHVD